MIAAGSRNIEPGGEGKCALRAITPAAAGREVYVCPECGQSMMRRPETILAALRLPVDNTG